MAEAYTFGNWGSTSEDILKSQFPLHVACRDGDVERLSLLLIQAQHGIYVEDSFYGWTPAHWAAYFGKLGCLWKLYMVTRVGADCNICTSRFKQTPLHLAAFGGHPQCIQWLLQAGADRNGQDYLGESPIHKAARTGSMECVSLLAANNATLYLRNNNGHSPAELAAMCGHSEAAQFLEGAALRQEAQDKGVFQTPAGPGCGTNPSPHDVTAGCKEPPAHADIPSALECEMEESEPEPGPSIVTPMLIPPITKGHSNDITIHTGISANHVPVAGRKRTREDNQEMDFKRARLSGVEQVEETVEVNSNIFMNGQPIGVKGITQDTGPLSSTPPVAGFGSMFKEQEQMCLNGFHNGQGTSPMNGQISHITMEMDHNQGNNGSVEGLRFGAGEGRLNGFCHKNNSGELVEDAIFGPYESHVNKFEGKKAVALFPDYVNTMDGYVGGGRPVDLMTNTSVVEHQSSVIAEQGYDSMFLDSVLHAYDGS